jgi:hypothetical protein
MKVLFLHNNDGDYLAASLFHGLRSILGADCVDCPRFDCLYSPVSPVLRNRLRGHGFTLYGLLPDIPELAERRHWWQADVKSYDLVILSDVWSRWDLLWELSGLVQPERIVVLDGSDFTRIFPMSPRFLSRPWAYLAPMAKVQYLKRELTTSKANRTNLKGARIKPISFSIPEEKIWQEPKGHQRARMFPSHIVDPEIASQVPESSTTYAFSEEGEYYADLRSATFGVTMKRAGWDSLRHYELAANGCILCFRALAEKPASCAPHGLTKENCLSYENAADFRRQIAELTPPELSRLRAGTEAWINANTTRRRAQAVLDDAFTESHEG